MKKYFKSEFFILCGAICFMALISLSFNNRNASSINIQTKFPPDSIKVDSLQLSITHESQAIIKYYENKSKIENLSDELANINNDIKIKDQKLLDLNSSKILAENSFNGDSTFDRIKKFIQSLDLLYNQAEICLTEKNKLISSRTQKEKDLAAYYKQTELKPKYLKAVKEIQSHSLKILGSKQIVFHGSTYNIFVASLVSNEIRLHLKTLDSNNKYYNIGSVKTMLESHKLKPLMITNGGMYTPSNDPEGLYIEDYHKLFEIDTNKSHKPDPDNFYLMPNGVFYIDNKGKAHIDTTQEFARKYSNEKIKEVRIATQSGPQLVINGRFNSAFNFPGTSKKTRSGVGVINDSTVVFIISKNETTFYDFAIVFKDIFNCNNALFLDGAISLMYLHDIDNHVLGGNFGPMISVTKK